MFLEVGIWFFGQIFCCLDHSIDQVKVTMYHLTRAVVVSLLDDSRIFEGVLQYLDLPLLLLLVTGTVESDSVFYV